MAKVDDKELYPLFYALHQHTTKQSVLTGVTIDDELTEAITRFARKHNNKPGKPESPLTIDRVKAIIKSIKHDTEIRILVMEDGPDSMRPKTEEELEEEQEFQEAEAVRMFKKFWISASYGVTCFILSQGLIIVNINRKAPEKQDITGPVMDGVGNQQMQLNPLEIAAIVLIVIAAWGIAEAVVIAKNHWADFDRVKGAVPFVGDAWLRRTKRKRKEKQQKLAKLNQRV